jgi:hypothetical protein
MDMNDSVETRLRESYGAAISKDPDRMSRAVDDIAPQESATLVDVGLYVSGYIVNDIYWDGLSDDNTRELAAKIVAEESDWIDVGDADTIVRFLNAAVTGDATTVAGLGGENLTRLVVVCGGHLLAYHRPDGQRWYEYLDEIWAPLNPCYDTTIGRPDGPTADRTVASTTPGHPPTPATGPQLSSSHGRRQAINSDRDRQPVASFAPSRLVTDIAMALATWGFEARINAGNIVQAHQSAWNLLTTFGIRPDPDDCPCLACGGAELHLSALDFIAATDPQLTGPPATTNTPAENDTGFRVWERGPQDQPPPAPYPPSRLVTDVMMILIQRGFEVSLHSKDLVQAHQSARTLLSILGQIPDTDRCPCHACGGPAIHLTRYNFVADDDPALTGLPSLTGGPTEIVPDNSAMNGDPGWDDGPPDTTPPVAQEPEDQQ